MCLDQEALGASTQAALPHASERLGLTEFCQNSTPDSDNISPAVCQNTDRHTITAMPHIPQTLGIKTFLALVTSAVLFFHLAQKQIVVTEHRNADVIGCAAHHGGAATRLRNTTGLQDTAAARRSRLHMLHRCSGEGGAALSRATHFHIRWQQARDHR